MSQSIPHQTISLLRGKVVQQVCGKSRSSFYRDIKSGLFTKPVQIGPNSVAWPASEIEQINKARIAGKSEDEIRALVIKLELARVA